MGNFLPPLPAFSAHSDDSSYVAPRRRPPRRRQRCTIIYQFADPVSNPKSDLPSFEPELDEPSFNALDPEPDGTETHDMLVEIYQTDNKRLTSRPSSPKILSKGQVLATKLPAARFRARGLVASRAA